MAHFTQHVKYSHNTLFQLGLYEFHFESWEDFLFQRTLFVPFTTFMFPRTFFVSRNIFLTWFHAKKNNNNYNDKNKASFRSFERSSRSKNDFLHFKRPLNYMFMEKGRSILLWTSVWRNYLCKSSFVHESRSGFNKDPSKHSSVILVISSRFRAELQIFTSVIEPKNLFTLKVDDSPRIKLLSWKYVELTFR